MAHLLGAVRHQMGPLLSLIFSRGGPSREGPSALGPPIEPREYHTPYGVELVASLGAILACAVNSVSCVVPIPPYYTVALEVPLLSALAPRAVPSESADSTPESRGAERSKRLHWLCGPRGAVTKSLIPQQQQRSIF